MELPGEVVDALVDQAYREMEASLAYARLASWADVQAYPGAARFFWKQSQDEYEHFQKFVCFLSAHDVVLAYRRMPEIPIAPTSYIDLFRIALDIEQNNTRAILNLLALAQQHAVPFAIRFLQDMVREQEEEIVRFRGYLQAVERIAREPGAILLFDVNIEKFNP